MSKIPLDSASKMVKIGIYTINWGGDNYYVWESTCTRLEIRGARPLIRVNGLIPIFDPKMGSKILGILQGMMR